jgi:hypothetical protein
MSRINLLMVAAAVAAGVVGCAQCDTCDDFPAPCTGPNCGQNRAGILDYLPPGPGQPYGAGAAPMGTVSPNTVPATDAAGPAPSTPPTPPVDPTSPAAGMDPKP